MNDIFSFIRETTDIVDVINRYIALKPAGKYLKGLSPFKYEKTASFTVTPSKKIFYCFSTGCGGDVIDFISRIENCSQMEAVKKIIEWYNITVPKELYNNHHTSLGPTAHKILDFFSAWCHNNLFNNKAAYKYCYERIPNDSIIKKYGLGYCPDDSLSIKHFLEEGFKKGFLAQDFCDAGIISPSKTYKSNYFFCFANRIIFPILNHHSGLVCGFGGRVIPPDIRIKYINSSSSKEFNKKESFFGLWECRNNSYNNDYVILVEGYFDVLSVINAKYLYCVATMGTNCTYNFLIHFSYPS